MTDTTRNPDWTQRAKRTLDGLQPLDVRPAIWRGLSYGGASWYWAPANPKAARRIATLRDVRERHLRRVATHLHPDLSDGAYMAAVLRADDATVTVDEVLAAKFGNLSVLFGSVPGWGADEITAHRQWREMNRKEDV